MTKINDALYYFDNSLTIISIHIVCVITGEHELGCNFNDLS